MSPQMVEEATRARKGAPVLALSKKDGDSVKQLSEWVRGLHHRHLSGAHVPTDPGPMAPHFHADNKGGHFHSHT
ncbi:hypothetical protein GCM10027440_38300 [Nocardiopsis coralliicola]